MNRLNKCQGKRVLLIEDQWEVRASIAMILRAFGAVVTEAENGDEALRVFSPGRFDTVITDYDMPGMLGDAVAEAIKGKEASQRVVMLSGFPEKAMPGGRVPWFLDEVIEKPPPLTELLEAI